MARRKQCPCASQATFRTAIALGEPLAGADACRGVQGSAVSAPAVVTPASLTPAEAVQGSAVSAPAVVTPASLTPAEAVQGSRFRRRRW